MNNSCVCRHAELIKQCLCKWVQIRWWRKCWVFVLHVRHSSQVVVLVKMGAIFVNLLKVVATVPQVEQIPCVVVAPVSRVVAAIVGEAMEGALRRHELAHSTGGERDLNTPETDVPVDIVFEDEGSLQTRIQEPKLLGQHARVDARQARLHAYHCRALRWPNHASIEPR
jgi:hypothetical protein